MHTPLQGGAFSGSQNILVDARYTIEAVPQAPEATEPKATPEATPKETPKATEPDAAAPEEEAEGGKKTTKAKSKSKKKAKPVEVEVEVQVGS